MDGLNIYKCVCLYIYIERERVNACGNARSLQI